MPHLRMRGLTLKEMKSISSVLLKEIVEITGIPKDHFTMEHIDSTFVFDGIEGGNKYPFVEVLWFDRGEESKEKVAILITDLLKPFNYDDVAVYFNNLVKNQYFENGKHF